MKKKDRIIERYKFYDDLDDQTKNRVQFDTIQSNKFVIKRMGQKLRGLYLLGGIIVVLLLIAILFLVRLL